MRLGIVRTPGEPAPGTGRVAAPGLDWARLGDTLVYWTGDDDLWASARGRAREAGVTVEELPAPAAPRDLHLVTQVGRVFQQEHPDVRVLVDKGRYLVAAIDAERLSGITPREEVCYRVEPLPTGEVVFGAAPAVARTPVAEIQRLVDEVSAEGFGSLLGELVGFGTRHSLSPGFRAAATMAADLLTQHGYIVRTDPVTVGSGQSGNVVAERVVPSRAFRDVVLLTAHLDSVNLSGGPSAPAPGADDNGSGAAGLLEIARVLAGLDARHDIRVILFGGEEQGLFGSTQYVAGLSPRERHRVRAVVNMDMIATLNTAVPTVLLEGAEVSKGLIDDLAAAAGTYTGLAVQTSLRPFNSDHVPFIDASIPAVLTIEGADSANEHVHTEGDTLDHIDHALALGILRMNVATLAAAAGV
ncbi:M28 family metallopeptidase [Spongiactinospora sp. TRM90649]|uniref:M28 family metallopeptidase n=1 Tax=Spongiactinospora sp. TRM90649 TaxID=3031114 RepID=UPI0023F70DAE|nr:M28 family metallopeptidase [Spongiactinospora sp. TRM90649]MDF5756947.1 M28 family metallopeptidase [Spongiactinospora sp. TRM90649]